MLYYIFEFGLQHIDDGNAVQGGPSFRKDGGTYMSIIPYNCRFAKGFSKIYSWGEERSKKTPPCYVPQHTLVGPRPGAFSEAKASAPDGPTPASR